MYYFLRTLPAIFSSSSGLQGGETVTGDATGAIGMLGILSKSFMWLLGSPSFTRFTLHLCMVSTDEATGEGASFGEPGDLGGDFCGELTVSGADGDGNALCSELEAPIIERFER